MTLAQAYQHSSKTIWFGEDYFLVSISYHSPSETVIDNSYFDMEAQFLHRSADGKQLVMSVLLEVKLAPHGNEFMAQFWDDFPAANGEAIHKYIFGPYSRGVVDALP